MAVIEERKSERGCIITVCDDKIHTPEEVKQIIKRAFNIAIQEEIKRHNQSTA
ncbi:MAG: hypothetical protein UFG06_05085 [Lachnospiraceae bacterium]|nr:hypothetical protein [Lachnospiraceae bacterium]